MMISSKIITIFRVTKNLVTHFPFAFSVHISCVHNSYDLNKLSVDNMSVINKNLNGENIITMLKTLIKMSNKNAIINENKHVFSIDKSSYSKIYKFLELNLNTLTVHQIMKILTLLRKLNISSSDNITQLLLEHLYSCVNDLSVIDINKVSHFFKINQNKDLFNNIQILLSKHFIRKLKYGFEENHIEYLANVVSFIGCHLKDEKLLEKYINKLNNNNQDISLRNAILIFESLTYISHFSHDFLNVLNRIQSSIINQINQLNKNQINFLILVLSNAVKFNRQTELYNAEFLNTIISKIITDDKGLNCALSALKCLSYIQHLNIDLINYACTKYFEETYLLQNEVYMEIPKLIILISSLASINRQPTFTNKITTALVKNKQILTYDNKTLCILSFNLLLLNCYPIDILDNIFKNEYDFTTEKYLHWTFCKIYQILKVNPNYNGPMPSEKQIKELKTLNQNLLNKKRNKNFLNLQKYLEKETGDEKYVITNVFTKLFHTIDFLIVFQSNGTPLEINIKTHDRVTSNIQYLEDFKFPSDSKIIIIQCCPSHWYFRNEQKLIGMHKCFIETLKAMSYIVLPISENTWYKIPEEEKAAYLKNEIQSILK